jgi:hypothetical protein
MTLVTHALHCPARRFSLRPSPIRPPRPLLGLRTALGLAATLFGLTTTVSAKAHPRTPEAKLAGADCRSARAADCPRTAERPTRWYGYQGAIADITAGALMFGAISTFKLCWGTSYAQRSCDNTGPALMLLGSLGTYALGAPVIHVAHGRVDKAALSFGLRAAPWVAAVPLGSADSGATAPVLIGGMLAAIVIDHAVLAHEPIEEPVVRVSPMIDPGRGSAALLVERAF